MLSPTGPPVPSRGRPRAPIAALLGFAAVSGLFRVRSYDVFWHLAAGRWIWSHGSLPHTDPFRFTSDAVPWVDHEWLFQVLLHGLETLVGLNGLVVARALTAVGLAILLLVALRRSGVPKSQAVLVALVGLLGARPRMFLRPEFVTLVILTTFLAVLQEARRATRTDHGAAGRPWLAAAAALVVLWANFHPGALVAPPVAGAYLLGSKLSDARSGQGWSWRTVVGFPALLVGLLALNPYGLQIFAVPREIGSSLEGLGGVNPEWLPLWSGPIAHDSLYFFTVLAALGMLIVATLRVGSPDGAADGDGLLARFRRLDGATGLAALALLVLSVTSIRHQPLFYMAAALFAGECLAGSWVPSEDASRNDRKLSLLATALCLLALLWTVLPPSRGPLAPRQGRYHVGLGLEPNRFPVGQVDSLLAWQSTAGGAHPVGPLHNNVAWGGYLLWRLFPPRQVFIDGRNEVNPGLLRELGAARHSNRQWNDMLERYGIDGAVVRYEQRTLQVIEASSDPAAPPRTVRRTPNSLFFPRERFALVYWDDVGMLLIRRSPERVAALRAVETRWVDPEDVAWTLRRAQEDPAFRERAVAEVRRKLHQDPDCTRAHRLLSSLLAL